MNYKNKLKEFFKIIETEISINPEFESKLSKLFLNENSANFPIKRKNKRNKALFDPIKSYEESKEDLLNKLNLLDIEELKDIISEFGMDPKKLVMKWKKKNKIINHIINVSEGRTKKGDAFRGSSKSLELARSENEKIEKSKIRIQYLQSKKYFEDAQDEYKNLYVLFENYCKKFKEEFKNLYIEFKRDNDNNYKIIFDNIYIYIHTTDTYDYEQYYKPFSFSCTFNEIPKFNSHIKDFYFAYSFKFDINDVNSWGWKEEKGEFFKSESLVEFLLSEIIKDNKNHKIK